jgi:SNF2 family DNA or RNA helicase
MGQTRPVTVYRLIAAGTIEEKIIRLHQTKKSLADSLLEGSNKIEKISAAEILKLLREE